MTPQVNFYDVPPDGRWPLVTHMAEAAIQKQKRLLVHCGDIDEAKALDAYLWTFKDEAFLPHEIANRPEELRDSEAHIVIVTTEARPIEASILVQLTPTSEAFARGFETVIDIVDHRDEALLAASRARYRAWREAGVVVTTHKH